jgi:hypothetical protein
MDLDKSASVRVPVQARSSVDANRPKRSSKAHEGSLCGRLRFLRASGFRDLSIRVLAP